MSVFENLTKKVTETAKAAARKSSDLVEVTKLNMSIGSEEDKIEKAYAEIGKMVYESHSRGEEVGDTFKDVCARVASHEENIREMRKKILEVKKVKLCPGCETELEAEVSFCPKCGAKQEEIPVPAVEETEKICTSCSASNSLDAGYCSKCGAKL